MAGSPSFASVLYGIFYPLNFPYLLLQTEVAIEAIAVLHLFAAGLFTYLYARAIDLSRLGAAVAAPGFLVVKQEEYRRAPSGQLLVPGRANRSGLMVRACRYACCVVGVRPTT